MSIGTAYGFPIVDHQGKFSGMTLGRYSFTLGNAYYPLTQTEEGFNTVPHISSDAGLPLVFNVVVPATSTFTKVLVEFRDQEFHKIIPPMIESEATFVTDAELGMKFATVTLAPSEIEGAHFYGSLALVLLPAGDHDPVTMYEAPGVAVHTQSIFLGKLGGNIMMTSHSLTLQNGFAQYQPTTAYREPKVQVQQNGLCVLTGLITAPTGTIPSGRIIANLPPEAHPDKRIILIVPTLGGFVRVDVTVEGNLVFRDPTGDGGKIREWVNLDGAVYFAHQD